MSNRHLTTEEFINRCKLIHGNKYDYSQTKYYGSLKDVTIRCYKHGLFKCKATAHIHKTHPTGCKKCNRNKQTIGLKKFIKRANKIHNNKYDYSQTNYVNAREKVNIICPTHGLWQVSPHNHTQHKSGCPNCAIEKRKNKLRSCERESPRVG